MPRVPESIRYFTSVVLGIFLAAAINAGLLCWSAGTPATPSAASIAGWYQRKIDIANRVPPPRILVVGGSSNLYGVRADRIEAATGIPTVNFGTHAALPLGFLLHEVKKIAKPGDTIILSLEYEFYTDKPDNVIGSDFVFGFDPGYILTLPPADAAHWAATASSDVLWRPILDLQPGAASGRKRRTAETAAQLDARGDFAENRPEQQLPAQRQAVLDAPPIQVLLGPKRITGKKVWTELRGFADWCRAHRIRLVSTFPATIRRPAYDSKPSARSDKALLAHYREIGVPVLGAPHDFLRPADDFFDTVYHLNSRAAAERTDQLAALLVPWLWESNPPAR